MVWRRSALGVMGSRPRGITFLAVYYAAVAVGLVVVTLVAIYGLGTIPRALAWFVYFPEALVGIAVGVGLVHVATAWGLWNLRSWARFLVVGLSFTGVVIGFFTFPLGFASVMLNLVTLWYITHYRVRDAFARSARSG
jgi:hypothetical protein